MALELEDGTGKANAETYAAIAVINDYAVKRGLLFNVTGDPAIVLAEAAARRATAWLDGEYRSRFPGRKRNGRAQALEWPRSDAVDSSGDEIADDELPAEIVAATCEAAIRELAVPGSLSPDVTPGKIKTRVRVEGAVDVTYAEGGVYGQAPTLLAVEGIIEPLLSGVGGGASVDLLRV
jgi:hypothetical protein